MVGLFPPAIIKTPPSAQNYDAVSV